MNSYQVDIFHVFWITGLFVIAGILGMVIGSWTSMKKSRARHQKIMEEKHCKCSCHHCE